MSRILRLSAGFVSKLTVVYFIGIGKHSLSGFLRAGLNGSETLYF